MRTTALGSGMASQGGRRGVGDGHTPVEDKVDCGDGGDDALWGRWLRGGQGIRG